MQGQVTVPYTGIYGKNMMRSNNIDPRITGSTEPGVTDGGAGTTVNLMWQYPGGITNQTVGDGIGWGYAVIKGTPCTDDDIKDWLLGNLISNRVNYDGTSLNPDKGTISEEDINNGTEFVKEWINKLMTQYVRDVLDIGGHYDTLRDNYPGCVVRG